MKDKKTEQEIIEIIAGSLKKHRGIYVKGLGTFSVQHQKQNQQQVKNGQVLLAPPTDVVFFNPDK